MKFLKELSNRPLYVGGMPVPMEDIGGGYAVIDTDDPVVVEALMAMANQGKGGITISSDAQVVELKKKLSEQQSPRPSRPPIQNRFRVERPIQVANVAAVDSSSPPPLRLPGQFTRPKPASAETLKAMAVPDESPVVVSPKTAPVTSEQGELQSILPKKPKPTK